MKILKSAKEVQWISPQKSKILWLRITITFKHTATEIDFLLVLSIDIYAIQHALQKKTIVFLIFFYVFFSFLSWE